MEGQSSAFIWIAYGAICAFVVLIVLIVLRTVVLSSLLLLLPAARLLRGVPGGERLVRAVERRAGVEEV